MPNNNETVIVIPKHITTRASRIMYELTAPNGRVVFCTVGSTLASCRAKRACWERRNANAAV